MDNNRTIRILKNLKTSLNYVYGDKAKVSREALDNAINSLDAWEQLEETIAEIEENNTFKGEAVTTVCHFLINYMHVLKERKNEEKVNPHYDECDYCKYNDSSDDYPCSECKYKSKWEAIE